MNEKIKNHLEDYNAACAKLNIPAELPDVSKLPEGMQNFILANTMLVIFIAAEKEGRVPDYNDNKGKYYPYWDMETYGEETAGSGFSLYDVTYELSLTAVGAPFVSESSDVSRNLAKKYKELYRFTMKAIQF